MISYDHISTFSSCSVEEISKNNSIVPVQLSIIIVLLFVLYYIIMVYFNLPTNIISFLLILGQLLNRSKIVIEKYKKIYNTNSISDSKRISVS